MGDKWPAEQYGITSAPPLQYCPTHRRWESWSDREGGCEWCCEDIDEATGRCVMGHSEDYWPEDEPSGRSERAGLRGRRKTEDEEMFEYIVLEES